jgi:hypothetical protein
MLPTRDEFQQLFGQKPEESLAILDAARDLLARACVLTCVSFIDKTLQNLFPPDDSRRGIPARMLPDIAKFRAIETHFAHNQRATFDDPGLPTLPLPTIGQGLVTDVRKFGSFANLTPQDRFIIASVLLHARLLDLIQDARG